MRLAKKIKCAKCGNRTENQEAYRNWHNVDCFESIFGLIDFVWVKNWWICPSCYPDHLNRSTRFHDIDGFTYKASWKFPFITRF
jgi:hypothetical protein